MIFLLLESELWRGCISLCCFRVGLIYVVVTMDITDLLLLVCHITLLLLYVSVLICYYFYDMDYVLVALGERGCVSVVAVASYFQVALGVREFIVVADRRCILSH